MTYSCCLVSSLSNMLISPVTSSYHICVETKSIAFLQLLFFRQKHQQTKRLAKHAGSLLGQQSYINSRCWAQHLNISFEMVPPSRSDKVFFYKVFKDDGCPTSRISGYKHEFLQAAVSTFLLCLENTENRFESSNFPWSWQLVHYSRSIFGIPGDNWDPKNSTTYISMYM